MRFLFFVSCFFSLFGCFSSTAFSQDMTPLRQAVAEESSPSRQVYAAERCAGLFSAVYARMSGTGREDIEQLAVKNLMLASEATMLAVEIGRDAGMNITSESVLQVSLRISEQYKKKMDASYDLTGNSFDEFILEDQEFCVSFIQQRGAVSQQMPEVKAPNEALPSDILVTKETLKDELISNDEACHLERISSLQQGGGLHEQIILVVGKSKAEGFGVLFSVNLILDDSGATAPFQSVEGNWQTDPSTWEEMNGMKVASGGAAIRFLISVFDSDRELTRMLINNTPMNWNNTSMVRFDGRGANMRYLISFGEKLSEFIECYESKKPRIEGMLTG